MSHFVKAKIPSTVVNIQFLGKLAKRNLCTNVKTPAKQLSPEIIAKREKYLLFERDFENKVDYTKLSDKEKEIHFLHKGNFDKIVEHKYKKSTMYIHQTVAGRVSAGSNWKSALLSQLKVHHHHLHIGN